MKRFLVATVIASVIASGCSSDTPVPAEGDTTTVPTEALSVGQKPTAEPVAPTAGAEATEPNGTITREMLGDEWPFTVEAGVVACDGGGVTFTAEGVTYAVNGTAKDGDMGADIMAIWADNPSVPGLKKDIGAVITRGLELCK